MRVSVLVTSYQRPELLKWHLKSLARQDIDDYEVIVLNDGIIDTTARECRPYPKVNYVFTGARNRNGPVWRPPGFALNIGAKLAKGNTLIISCAEMFLMENDILRWMAHSIEQNPKQLVATKGADDDGRFLAQVKEFDREPQLLHQIYDTLPNLNTRLPFYMAVSKDEYCSIGGYDEDFTKEAFDDDDFVERMQGNGCTYRYLERRVVHLYHPRPGPSANWQHNFELYSARKGQIVRNIGREWGVL